MWKGPVEEKAQNYILLYTEPNQMVSSRSYGSEEDITVGVAKILVCT